mmetsp:Transcript_30535/g.79206  ORF Transcript_30535/g.79206 Transcript_30535/m.79206 type:complete len:126 (+) Transcript_30535:1635-2012(+)
MFPPKRPSLHESLLCEAHVPSQSTERDGVAWKTFLKPSLFFLRICACTGNDQKNEILGCTPRENMETKTKKEDGCVWQGEVFPLVHGVGFKPFVHSFFCNGCACLQTAGMGSSAAVRSRQPKYIL